MAASQSCSSVVVGATRFATGGGGRGLLYLKRRVGQSYHWLRERARKLVFMYPLSSSVVSGTLYECQIRLNNRVKSSALFWGPMTCQYKIFRIFDPVPPSLNFGQIYSSKFNITYLTMYG